MAEFEDKMELNRNEGLFFKNLTRQKKKPSERAYAPVQPHSPALPRGFLVSEGSEEEEKAKGIIRDWQRILIFRGEDIFNLF